MIKIRKGNYPYDVLSVYFSIQLTFVIPISYIRYGILNIWTLIRSCFGSGFWRNSYKWINSEKWKN